MTFGKYFPSSEVFVCFLGIYLLIRKAGDRKLSEKRVEAAPTNQPFVCVLKILYFQLCFVFVANRLCHDLFRRR